LLEQIGTPLAVAQRAKGRMPGETICRSTNRNAACGGPEGEGQDARSTPLGDAISKEL
jgi:hypothetical protein